MVVKMSVCETLKSTLGTHTYDDVIYKALLCGNATLQKES